ncbi:MAG: FemAB family XrtA/PEP-CTERM system-associated protein [Pseudomonadota bacterium]
MGGIERVLVPRQEAAGTAVRRYGDADRARWSAFVAGCPEATFFHRIEWKEVIEGVFGHRTHYLLAEEGGEVVGVLPLAETKSLIFGHRLASLPFCAYGGVAAVHEGARRALIEAARALGRDLGADHLELRHREPRQPAWPRQDLYVTFRKTLAPEPEANLKAVPRKQRAMVRKGIKAGLSSEIDATVDRFFRLYADNVHRHGTPALPQDYFRVLQQAFGDACEVLTVVDPAGRPVSSVLSFYFRDEVLPYYAGDDASARELAANDFKYWELMRRACERGVRVFDYGRSKQGTGSYDFKRHWGFEPAPLYYEYYLYRGGAIPQHNPLNPKYRAFIALWRRLPLGLANALGPRIVRHLG